MVPASIIVCTHNRAAVVGAAVKEALAQAIPVGAEVLVVDNASTDDTPRVLTALRRDSGPQLRLLEEPRLGLSTARNRGLAEARGDVSVFLDDDAIPRAGWLRGLLRPFTDDGVACVGGRIVIRFPHGKPSWFRPELSAALSGFDLGEQPRRVRYGRVGDLYPYGANIAFRASAARAVGGFSSLVGLHGRHLLAHEETDLCYRLEESGWAVHYAPDAVVDHCVSADRLTPEWLLRRHTEGGRSAAVFILRNRGILRAVWRVWWLYRSWLLTRPYTPSDHIDGARLVEECRRREARGYLGGLGGGILRVKALRRDRMNALSDGSPGTAAPGDAPPARAVGPT